MSNNRILKNTPQDAKEITEWDDIEGSEESEIIHGYNNKLIGNSGSDELIGLSRFTSVGYRNSPEGIVCLLYTSPSPRDRTRSRMPSSA